MRREDGTPRRHESEAFETARERQARPPESLRRNLLLKVIIYSVIAALTVIGLETLGVKILPFFNMTRRVNTESDDDGDDGEKTHSVDCSVFAPPAVSVGHWMMVQIFLHPPDIADTVDTVEEAAVSFDTTAALRGFSSLSLRLRDGARVGFQLQCPF
jgi:hypothetical protein